MRPLFLILFLNSFYLISQGCAYDFIIKKKVKKNPEYKIAYQKLYNEVVENGFLSSQETYYIPVVFHIVYNQDSQNLPDSVIESQIDILNEDFRRLNTNASETRDEFLDVVGDPNIEFFLANIDPNGNPSNGIVRTYTDRTEFLLVDDIFSNEIALDEVKFSETDGSDAWDTNKYLNIWICNIGVLDLFGFDLGQVFGYAYPPTDVDDALANIDADIVPDWPVDMLSSDEDVQGVVLHYTAVGRNNSVANDDGMTENNLGRAAVHEVGHYLGLRHIWGDAVAFSGEDGCSVDDGIEDTPKAMDQAGYVCDFNKNTCEDDQLNDLPDMVENYMDYSPGACQNAFTNGQINVMRTILEISRPGLINGGSSLHLNSFKINQEGNLIHKVDILGREVSSDNSFYIEIFDNGNVNKKYTIR